MKIKVEKKTFLKALQIGGAFAGNNKLLPILDCVKLRVKNSSLTIVSSDSENAISHVTSLISQDEENAFCVIYKDLISYVKLIPSESFSIETDGKSSVQVIHEKGKIELPFFPADVFPVIKPDEESVELSLSSALLNNWIVDGRKFVGNNDLRPIMNGLYIYGNNGEVGCCATDGNSLFTDYIDMDGISDFNFIINPHAFNAICNAISESDTVKLRIGVKNAMFSVNGTSIIIRGIEGKYPNFKGVLPTDSKMEVNINTKDFVSSLNRCRISANQIEAVRLSIDGMTANVSCDDIDFNKKASETIMVSANGVIKICFKVSYLLNILNSISTNNTIMNMNGGSYAAVFREDDEENRKKWLLMPMQYSE